MTNTGTARGTGVAPARRGGRAVNVALWALQILLALVFAMAGLAKVFDDPAMVEMFATIGVGQWFRYVVGALEISGAVGVPIPRFSGSAAIGLVCVMLGDLHQPVRPRREPGPPAGLAGGERRGRLGPPVENEGPGRREPTLDRTSVSKPYQAWRRL